jgi:hypothetical protein
MFRDFSAATAAALSSGEYLKDKPGGEKEAANPLDPKNMDQMMDGMKKQAVMMWVWLQTGWSGHQLEPGP